MASNAAEITNPVTCDGCGHYHGSVNAEMICLRTTLAAARGRAHNAEATIREMRRPAREYYRSLGWPECASCGKLVQRGSTKFADPCVCKSAKSA